MGAAIELRGDYDGVALRRLARSTRNAKQGRRLLALAETYDGSSSGDAARIGGVRFRSCATGWFGPMPEGRTGWWMALRPWPAGQYVLWIPKLTPNRRTLSAKPVSYKNNLSLH
jgi:hypothetical protein